MDAKPAKTTLDETPDGVEPQPEPAIDIVPSVVGEEAEATSRADTPTPTLPDGAATDQPMPIFHETKNPYRKYLIGGIVAVAALLLGGGGVYAYGQYQKPENVVMNSVLRAMTSRHVQAKTTVTSPYIFDTGDVKFKLQQLTLDTRANVDPRYDYNTRLEIEVNGKFVTTAAQVFADNNGDVYFRLHDLERTIRDVYRVFDEDKAADQVIAAVNKIQNKWVKYSIDDLRSQNADAAKYATCVTDTFKKHADDKTIQQEIRKKYQSHPFVRVASQGTSRDGLAAYDVTIDNVKLNAYIASMLDTEFAREIQDCAPKSYRMDRNNIEDTLTPDTADDSLPKISTRYTVLVDPWLHDLRRVETETTIKYDHDKSTTVSTKTELSYDSGVKLQAPEGAAKFDDWRADAEKFAEALMNHPPESLEQNQKSASAEDMARQAATVATSYSVDNRGNLPANASVLSRHVDAEGLSDRVTVTAAAPVDETTVQYVACSSRSAYVVYRDVAAGHLSAVGVGSAIDVAEFDPSTVCRANLI